MAVKSYVVIVFLDFKSVVYQNYRYWVVSQFEITTENLVYYSVIYGLPSSMLPHTLCAFSVQYLVS